MVNASLYFASDRGMCGFFFPFEMVESYCCVDFSIRMPKRTQTKAIEKDFKVLNLTWEMTLNQSE